LALGGSQLRAALAQAADGFGGDPLRSLQWADLRREFFGNSPLQFDERVQVRSPAFAEDAMACRSRCLRTASRMSG